MRKVGILFFKCTILLFLYPALCVAEQYDTGWMRLEAEDLQELTFTGNDVTVNNFNLNIDNNLLYGNANALEFTASAINRSEDSKSVSIQLISRNKEDSYGFALSAQP